MRKQWKIAAVCLGLLAAAVPAFGQRGNRRSGNLAAQANWVQFRIVGGRVTATSHDFGQTMSSSSGDGRQESVTFSQTAGELFVQYDLTTPKEKTSIHLKGAGELTARSLPLGDSTERAIEFVQEGGRRCRMTLGQGGDQLLLEAPTLWHLALAAPEAARQELAPLLEIIQPAWKLADALDVLEVELRRSAVARQAPDRKLWGALVADLASHRYAVRNRSDRNLRAAGAAIVPFLRSLDRSALDAEQRLRIAGIVDALAGGDEDDTPQRVADWLAWDPQLWFLLLGREDEPTRRLAAEQLQLLSNQPIDFDPAAEPAQRAAQMERLRPRFAAPNPAPLK